MPEADNHASGITIKRQPPSALPLSLQQRKTSFQLCIVGIVATDRIEGISPVYCPLQALNFYFLFCKFLDPWAQ